MTAPHAPWWRFWNPNSGFAGGFTLGLLVFVVLPGWAWLVYKVLTV